ncbi:IS4 family transposase MICBce3 [Pseudoalteromonas holothuriae]|uniref:IS4 family transposase MICBce3 n=1 Tax=Pseudoalteromonas holothuriae TaxID=2963714 RepID=A0A9W4QQL6_9GAMM|nr:MULTISPECIES: serine hydrolase domain-containing protein [unclassified Pseudoalteromonas]CAH9049411.1 IS4 family transposase MICBce3 [Pseudoalteromonas sp. CIP111854]CAH9056031.1 IS4 family transposase MICBce3 [Pseudoalteromonas sp. CIP111951]
MKTTLGLITKVTIVCATLTITGCGSNSAKHNNVVKSVIDVAATEFDYQQLLNDTVKNNVPGVVLYIQSPTVEFYGAAGLADINTQTMMQIDARIPNGSAGKKLTALLAAMLHEEGRFDLDAPISQYLPTSILSKIQYSQLMTTRQLLSHTSGVFDYLADNDGEFYQAVQQQPNKLITDSFALHYALDKPAHFSPGSDWRYSNTGYILAGLILNSVLGEHHSKALRDYVLDPLGLTSMSYGGIEKAHAEIVSGYFLLDDKLENTQSFYSNIGVADAPVVGDARDMAELLRHIVESEQINESLRQLLIGDANLNKTGQVNQRYGMGIFVERYDDQVVYYHGGDELGYATRDYYFPKTQTAITMLFNCNGYRTCEVDIDNMRDTVLKQFL